MKEYIYFYKLNPNWSDAIEKQAKLFSDSGSISYSLKYKFTDDFSFIFKLKSDGKKIIVNHSINSWYLLFLSIISCNFRFIADVFKGGVLLAHEGEPLFKNKRAKRGVSYRLLTSRIYHLVISKWFRTVVILNSQQRKIYGRGVVVNFLGVDRANSESSCEIELNDEEKYSVIHSGSRDGLIMLFPQNKERLEKGYNELLLFLNSAGFPFSLYSPLNVENRLLIASYAYADIVVIPSIEYETYSLTLIEALMSNKIILASSNLGLIQNMLKLKTLDRLKDLGLFVFDDINSFDLKQVLEFKRPVNTVSLYEELNLDCLGAFRNLQLALGENEC